MKCIICKKEEAGSTEHIIPMAMGNEKFTTDHICRICNSRLGSFVDNYFTNHIIIKFLRDAKGWYGESGKAVKVLPKTAVDEKSRKKFKLEQDGAHILPVHSLDNGILTVEAENIEEAIKYAKKRLERMGYKADRIEEIIKNNVRKIKSEKILPEFKLNADIDKGKFLLLPLKIAYEYAEYRLGDIIKYDVTIEKIRMELYNAIYEKHEMNYKFISTHAQIAGDDARQILKMVKKEVKNSELQIKHLIVMHRSANNQLVCNIYMGMENIISFSVLLMEKIPLDVRIKPLYITILTEQGEVIDE